MPQDATKLGAFPSAKALPPFAALKAFDAVARFGGVRRAAVHMNVDHAVISRHLRTLEEWMNTRLVERSRRGVVLTQEGRRYHRQIAAAIEKIAEATTEMMNLKKPQTLHIWCMPAFVFQWLIGRFEEFENANADLSIDLRPGNSVPDIVRREADVDIRFTQFYGRPFEVPGELRTFEFARPRTNLVASPKYLAKAPPITQARDLLDHPLIHRETFDTWQAWFAAQRVDDLPDLARTGPRLNHGHLMLDAARRGRGISLSNEVVSADDVAAGRLVEVIPTIEPFRETCLGAYVFVARADRWNETPIRDFRNWLCEAVGREFPQFETALAAR